MLKRERLSIGIRGHLRILEYQSTEDYQLGEKATVLLDQHNDVHRENASILVTRALTDRENHSFFYMVFGNGGAVVDPVGNLTFNPTNTTGAADLYSPLFYVEIDDISGTAPGNYMKVEHVKDQNKSTIVIHAVIEKHGPLPNSQLTSINATSDFQFNEIGLKTRDGLLITHIVFAPVTKAANSILTILYTITVEVNAPDTFGGLTKSIYLEGVQAISSIGTFSI